jgi:hypothetical protein
MLSLKTIRELRRRGIHDEWPDRITETGVVIGRYDIEVPRGENTRY